MDKVSHAVAQYGPGRKDGDHCVICEFYTGHHCKKVVDPIAPMGWCRFFKKDTPHARPDAKGKI